MTDPRYWLSDPGGTPQGPYPLSQVQAFAAAGRVGPQTMACPEGAAEWAPIASILGGAASGPPPAPPAPLPSSGAAPGPPSAEEQALGFMVPIGADPMAIAASYLGLFGLLLFPLGILALVLGILAYRRRARYPQSANTVRCIVSIALGALGTAIPLVVLVVVLLNA